MKKRFFIYMIWVMFLVSCLTAGAVSQETAKKRLDTVKEKYNYAKWAPETGNVIPGVMISEKIFPQLKSMRKMWETDDYSIEQIQDTTYTKIRKWWKLEDSDSQVEVTMVVCPTFGEAKEYLIAHYANTQMPPQITKPVGKEVGMDIGNVCFAAKAKKEETFAGIDFIRHNVIILMRAEGDFKNQLGTIARTLDGLLSKKEAAKNVSELEEIPTITRFSCEKAAIKRGESVPLHLEINNPAQLQLRYFWKMSGGGVEKDLTGNFVYYGGDEGKHTITVTVLNDLGLHHSRSLEIEVVK